ncbi:uncharacterized protein LOC135705107 [Ochlerotatus camptorhynchus]|uniref:uncharacterized protein LOC135705107 n=1 Tax=Ochlerotatus camptorhynchus TaxID=644619 RepID=UPI0031E2247E
MLFELERDPTVKSAAFKELNDITTEHEFNSALKVQCNLGDVPIGIRLRKAYGGTQTASIRISSDAANELLKTGRIKVGWSVCPLKAIPRATKQMERCFNCMNFGHQARNCKGPDRSDLCRKCGEKGHVAKDCTKQPMCMLCKKEDGNGV